MYKPVTFTITTIILACALSARVPNISEKLETRIIGGDIVPIELYPWQIEINEDGVHACGGSIYSSNIVITAAHCLTKKRNRKIFAGTSYSNSSGSEHEIVAYNIHEHYCNETLANDIAVLRISPDFEFSATIQPIALAERSPKNNALAFISGWGRQTENGASELELHAAEVRIIDREMCKFKLPKPIPKGIICAGLEFEHKGACRGDSGGPLVSNNQLIGIMSGIKKNCTYAKLPATYTDVAFYRSWIEETIDLLLD